MTLILLVPARGIAGGVLLASDVSVAVTAEPASKLEPGQSIIFTVAVTNEGPAPLLNFGVSSSPLFPEQIDLYGSTTDCGVVVTGVTDGSFGYSYDVTWYPTDSSYTSPNDLPLSVGETRTCHFTFRVGPTPPPKFSLDFHLGTLWSDPNATNDVGVVALQLAPAVESVPTLSLPGGALLSSAVVAFAIRRRRRLG